MMEKPVKITLDSFASKDFQKALLQAQREIWKDSEINNLLTKEDIYLKDTRQLFDKNRMFGFMIQTECGEIAAIILVSIYDEKYPQGNVRLIWVSDKYRGMGFGQTLLEVTETELTERQIPVISLTASTWNSDAIKLYRKFGFEENRLIMKKNIGEESADQDIMKGILTGTADKIAELDSKNRIEALNQVGRWNILCEESQKSKIYSQSAIFFPLDISAYQNILKKNDLRNLNSESPDFNTKIKTSLTSIELRPTDFCNSNCFFCFSKKESKDFTKKQISTEAFIKLKKSIIKLAKDHFLTVRFCGGGEPLCHSETLPVIEAFESNGIPTNLITNGLLLDEEKCDLLARHSTMVRFSIDAGSSATYSRVHGQEGKDFNRLLKIIKTLVRKREEYGRKDSMFIGATFLVCEHNWMEIEKFSNLAKTLGLDLVWIKAVNDLPHFDSDTENQIIKQLHRAEELNTDSFHVSLTRFKVARRVKNLYSHQCDFCYSIFTKAFIQPDGDVALCLSRKDYSLGNIHNQDFSEIIGGEKHLNFIKKKGWINCTDCLEARYNKSLAFLADAETTVSKGYISEEYII